MAHRQRAIRSKRGPRKNGATSRSEAPARTGHEWDLRLYVVGRSPRSQTALANLRRLCEEHVPGRYAIEIVDLLNDPQLAKADQILAVPTLVRKLPTPVKRLIGDLSDSERAIVALDLRASPPDASSGSP